MKFIWNRIKCALQFSIIVFVLFNTSCKTTINDSVLNLSGTWAFQIDSADVGERENWFNKTLNDEIKLPGSMLTNSKGYDVKPYQNWTGMMWNTSWFTDDSYLTYRNPENVKISFWLQPEKYYTGPAWYQKEIIITDKSNDEFFELFLERCHWETKLWIDSTYVEMNNSLATPHLYVLPKNLKPGKHKITLRIDNRVKEINPGLDAHSISDNTQTNWNGVIGKMELRRKSKINFEYVSVFPDTKSKLIDIQFALNEIPENINNYQINVSAHPKHFKGKKKIISYTLTPHDPNLFSVKHVINGDIKTWDEFNPNIYSLKIELVGNGDKDVKVIDFGFRDFDVSGKHFLMNGRRIFLRGTLECSIFPKTGYPPMKSDEWIRIFKISKNHGLNHIRFHSWCPPKAAFEAADSIGMYLSVECGAWTEIGSGYPIDTFIIDESKRIVQEFGNHPSFCMMAYGNEPHGEKQLDYLRKFVNYWKNKDPRRLYTTAFGWANIPENDFQSSAEPRIQHWEEGLNSIINSMRPSSAYDWNEITAKYDQPTISHEIGQWCVYPNFNEIEKYSGPIKAKNFEIFKDRLTQSNLIHLADSFILASGKLQVLCYKADIEAAFRTTDLGGFQLLGMNDFPGQGSAIVGILDPFWDEKGYISPIEFKQFCNSTVPLARLDKLIYKNNEKLSVDFELAHYSENELLNVIPEWSISDENGINLFEGKLPKQNNITFGLNSLGREKIHLNKIIKEKKLTLELKIGNLSNRWEFWVYPSELPNDNYNDILVTNRLDERSINHLSKGGNVLLTALKGSIKPEMGGNIGVGFSSIFWNTSWTNGQLPHTLGILCNPNHPVFNHFPTEFHSNYQWWDTFTHSNVICIDKICSGIKPLIRVIDDWNSARNLAFLFECKVGEGRMIVSGIDLISDVDARPEASQLLYSIKTYMSSNSFNPNTILTKDQIRMIFKKETS